MATELALVGGDVVEVIPTAWAPADASAVVADRIVREALTGIAVRRLGGERARVSRQCGNAIIPENWRLAPALPLWEGWAYGRCGAHTPRPPDHRRGR